MPLRTAGDEADTPGAAGARRALQRRLTAPSARPGLLAGAYLAWLTAAELISSLGEPRLGLLLHAGLLIALIYHAARDLHDPLHQLLLTLAFAPLIRLMSFSLPLASFPQVAWYFIVSLPLFVAAWLVMRVLGYSRRDIGLRVGPLPLQLLIALTGLTFGYVEYRILAPAPLAAAFTWQKLWLPALILLVSTGFLEELIFRGLMQRAAVQTLGQGVGVLYVSLVFAVLHAGYKSLLDVVFVFVVALFFGWIVARTRSLLGVTLAHGLTNIMLFLVMPYLTLG
ncbi:MAG: CPBP family intramembrane metalloprotease [Anaerolinea sp.]|nr:CPBP family intramembrane metalloprotease [Anaerolinea sp.]